MAPTRTQVPGPNPAVPAYEVVGTDAAFEHHETQDGDLRVLMGGGTDLVRIEGLYDDRLLRVELGDGNDVALDRNDLGGEEILGGTGNDLIAVGSGDGGLSSAFGEDGNDVLRSLGGAEVFVQGGHDGDLLFASEDGRDILVGGRAKDHLFLAGGQGDTVRLFTGNTALGEDRDIVHGFEPAGEAHVIDLHGMDADRTIPGNQDFIFDGEVPGGDAVTLEVGHAAWFREGKDLVVIWNNGSHEAAVLAGLGEESLSEGDFLF